MKFEVSATDFFKQLQKAGGAIVTNPVLPILEDFLFEAYDNKLTIASTNLETSIVTQMDVQVKEEGKVAVPAKILMDTLKELPDHPITFSSNNENQNIEITSSYGKYKLSGDNPDDFPELPTQEDTHSITISPSQLANAVNNTLFATSNDELRLAMTGVYVLIDYNKILMVATDAHKLVKYTIGDITSEVSQSFIIPKKGLTLARNVVQDKDDDVEVSFNTKNVFFTSGTSQISCRLIDAKYPDYNAVIPVDNKNELQVGRTDFQHSLKRIAIYANKTTNQVVLNLSEGSLTISAQDIDFSNEATEQLPCNYSGDPMSIGFNAKFLIEMLGVLNVDDVRLQLSTPNKAGILLPNEEDSNESILMLVMPVMMSH